jgi:hypothetical protein
MPIMVKLAANPAFKSTDPVATEAWKVAKAKGTIEVDYVTAMENIQLSGGIYSIIPEATTAPAPGPRRLEDMTLEELKVIMLSLGIKTEKQMKRSDIERLVRSKMAEIDIVEE